MTRWLLLLLLTGCAPKPVAYTWKPVGYMEQPFPGCDPVLYEDGCYQMFDGETTCDEYGLGYACPQEARR